MSGQLGIADVCLSLPTIVGRAGVLGVVEIGASDEEKEGIRNSARILKETLAAVG